MHNQQLKTKAHLPDLFTNLLADRNVRTPADMDAFLFPKLNTLPHPSGLMGAETAAKRVCRAIKEGEEIIVWGDYDVDGTTGTSLLLTFFRDVGVEARYYIPDRLSEGYGLKAESFFREFREIVHKPFLLLTVDCGISDAGEVEKISAIGGEVIVTDHHQLPLNDIPDCIVVNPSQSDCGFKNEKLAGVGVAFFLAAAIRYRLDSMGYFVDRAKPNLKQYLGFVALGTISDLVDLTVTNRILVKAGLETLTECQIPGLRSLVESAGIGKGNINSEDIGFSIGPRINAAGRLGSASIAVDLMVCDNLSEGAKMSKELEEYNNKRKQLCEECYHRALIQDNSSLYSGDYCIISSGSFHSGIIGIVASRLVDKYQKPALVFSKEIDQETGGTIWKGSGRSVNGVNIIECLHGCSHLITRYGGHEMAAGLSIESARLEEFLRHFDRQVEIAKRNLTVTKQCTEESVIDCSIDEVMNDSFLECFELLEPFGPGNERPIFKDRNAVIIGCRAIGSDKQHLQLTLRGRYDNHRAIAFGMGARIEEIRRSDKRDVYFTPMINRYRNMETWQVRVVDVKTS